MTSSDDLSPSTLWSRAIEPIPAASLDEPLTDRLLDPGERAFRARLRAVLDAEVAPRAEEASVSEEAARASYQVLAKENAAAVLFPAAYGGMEASTVAYVMAVEEVAAVCASTSLIYMTQTHAAFPLLYIGTSNQKERYLPGLANGTLYGSIAISEPDAGSDAAAMRTSARQTEYGYILNGAKTFITSGDCADVIVCFATLDPSVRHRGITAFVISGETAGLQRGRVFSKLGMRGSSTAELVFDDMALPKEALLGAEGDGWRILIESLLKTRLSAAAQGVGIARAAYARAAAWFREGCPFGATTRDEVEVRLTELRTDILLRRLLLYSVASSLDSGSTDMDAQIAMMKKSCTDLGTNICRAVVEMLAPLGDLRNIGVERLLRDVKVTQIYDGTNQVQQMLIARDTLRRIEIS